MGGAEKGFSRERSGLGAGTTGGAVRSYAMEKRTEQDGWALISVGSGISEVEYPNTFPKYRLTVEVSNCEKNNETTTSRSVQLNG